MTRKPLSILQINYADLYGGAAIAGHRLHQGLLDQGHESKLLVRRIKFPNARVMFIRDLIPPPYQKPFKWVEDKLGQLTETMGLNSINHIATTQVSNHPWFQHADVIQLHNLHGGYFNYLMLPLLSEKKPIIWTLHDMWAMTGHCSYSFDCERWKHGCGQCPYPNTYPHILRDNTRVEWRIKQWLYRLSQDNLYIICPSQWLYKLCQQSILKNCTIYHVPNGLDLSLYQPLDQATVRQELGLPLDRNYILFGVDQLSDTRKGGDIIQNILLGLPDSLRNTTSLLVFGKGEISSKTMESLRMPVHQFGFVEDETFKVKLYNAATVFVLPTQADNLPIVLQESLACGTPMVSFDVGGVSDIIRHGQTGFLATPGKQAELTGWIEILLSQPTEKLELMKNQCRQHALKEFDIKQQIAQYTKIYQQALRTHKK